MVSFEPFLTLTVLPDTLALDSIIIAVVAYSALLAVRPHAFVLSSVFPDEPALSMSFVLLEVSNILFAVWPH